MRRVLAIVQLCLAFSLTLWVLAGPFTGDYFATRSSLLYFQMVTGHGHPSLSADALTRHAVRFSQLDPTRQQTILNAYRQLEKQIERSFLQKIGEAFRHLFFELSLFTQGWIFFSILLPLLLLYRVEGVESALWILPLLTLCFAIEARLSSRSSSDQELLPTESALLQNRELDLKEAWKQYLIREWANETPSLDPKTYAEQVEAGEHAFVLTRLENQLNTPSTSKNRPEQPLPLLALYLLWNLYFALRLTLQTPLPLPSPRPAIAE